VLVGFTLSQGGMFRPRWEHRLPGRFFPYLVNEVAEFILKLRYRGKVGTA